MADALSPRIAVLLVEDHPLQLMEAASTLRDAGYEVAEAATVAAIQSPSPVAGTRHARAMAHI